MLDSGSRHSESTGYSSALGGLWHQHTLGILILPLFILNQPIIHPGWILLLLDNLLFVLVFVLPLLVGLLLFSHYVVVIIFSSELHHRA